jgi:hypothetical protein
MQATASGIEPYFTQVLKSKNLKTIITHSPLFAFQSRFISCKKIIEVRNNILALKR